MDFMDLQGYPMDFWESVDGSVGLYMWTCRAVYGYYRAILRTLRICVAVHIRTVWAEIQEDSTHEVKML